MYIDEKKLKEEIEKEYEMQLQQKLLETSHSIEEKLRLQYLAKSQSSQELLELERSLRLEMEKTIQFELDKRMALESKLQQYELEQLRMKQVEEEKQRQLELQTIQRQHAKCCLQKVLTCYLLKKRFSKLLKCIRTVQSTWRMHTAHTQYKQLKIFTSLVQALWRKKLLSKTMAIMNSNARIIQLIWHGYQTRKHYKCQTRSIIKIQSMMRGSIMKKQFHKTITKIVQIQSHIRKFICSRRYQQLQRLRQAKLNQKKEKSARSILNFFKNILIDRKSRYQHLKEKERQFNHRCKMLKSMFLLHSFTLLCHQRMTKKKSVLRIIRWYKAYIPLMKARKLRLGITRLQSVFRGSKQRQILAPEIRRIYHRVKDAESYASAHKECTLYNRTKAAIEILENEVSIKSVVEMKSVCQVLYTTTMYSPVCCRLLTDTWALSSFLSLMKSCTRSLPHQELLW